ncbi:VOC family protein [Kibdelosporangium persicum]|uniref:Glyoxalase/bleomycin resistance protein/dioxygenase n=1 Tax=Kibdelosporangium persicum TaxID=2698649 RepID=A0ABX2FFA7_9PSEU|nr:VOC family protein [Kibdelosporangium persicum]NRN69420.1 Glyoxalase/bleomycin resistance protein/dioxygenase [Kibdelosporangium persicum]
MAAPTPMRVSGVVFSAPDPRSLAAFYQRLLGWPVQKDEPGWVKLAAPDGGPGLSFHEDPDYVPPVWPSTAGEQQMMVHLDIGVDDIEKAGQYAVELGAKPADFQPQEHVRVYFDPIGHPFCLFLDR